MSVTSAVRIPVSATVGMFENVASMVSVFVLKIFRC